MLLLLLPTVLNLADDFVDDIYYQPKTELKKKLAENRPVTPYYNKNVKEIIFLDDTVANPHPDTVRAVVRYTDSAR